MAAMDFHLNKGIINNNNNWNLYSAFSIHKMFKSAAQSRHIHFHSMGGEFSKEIPVVLMV